MEDDAVSAAIGKGQCVHVALSQAGPMNARLCKLHAGEPQHFRRTINPDRPSRARRKQFEHATRAGTYIQQRTDRPIRQQPVDGRLDFGLGDMERTNAVPVCGMIFEISPGRLGAFGANDVQPTNLPFAQILFPAGCPTLE